MIEAGGIRMPGNPVKIDGYDDPAERAGAPELDQHGAALRKEFGGVTPRCTSQLMVVRARLRRLSEDWPKVLGTAAVLGGFDEEGRRADAGGLVRCGVGRQTGRMSFPQVVIDEQIVGGYQELISLTAQHGPAPRRLPRAA